MRGIIPLLVDGSASHKYDICMNIGIGIGSSVSSLAKAQSLLLLPHLLLIKGVRFYEVVSD